MKHILLWISLFCFCVPGYSQKPAPTEKEVLLTVIVENSDHSPREGDQVFFKGQKSKKVFKGATAADGKFYLLLPKGEAYAVQYKSFQDSVDYSKLDIPSEPGKISYEYTLTIEPPKIYTLRNVHFDTGKATLRPESFAALSDLAEVMKAKKKMMVEIAGHTDDVGDDAANLKLSQSRAETVRSWLIAKGIEAQRITAKGYGETQPTAGNDTDEGRQLNRRTEVRITHE